MRVQGARRLSPNQRLTRSPGRVRSVVRDDEILGASTDVAGNPPHVASINRKYIHILYADRCGDLRCNRHVDVLDRNVADRDVDEAVLYNLSASDRDHKPKQEKRYHQRQHYQLLRVGHRTHPLSFLTPNDTLYPRHAIKNARFSPRSFFLS